MINKLEISYIVICIICNRNEGFYDMIFYAIILYMVSSYPHDRIT